MKQPKKIKFTIYRTMLEHFERVVNVDYHACVGEAEKKYWVKRAGDIFTDMNKVTCCKEDLINRFENTADRSTNQILNITGGLSR